MEALTFLDHIARAKPLPFYVLHGDESFLERQVTLALRTLVLGPDDDGFGVSSHAGDKATWADVLTDVRTLPMLSPRRFVIVENADPFVTRERAKLEKFVSELPTAGEARGVLLLSVKTWTASTKLAKMTPDANSINCKSPPSQTLPGWCVNWCATRHKKQLVAQAAKLLVDLVGSEMGLLDMEMEKLSVYVGSAPKIDSRDVDQLVGRSRTESTWEIFNLIGSAKSAEALSFLSRLLDQGEEPMKLLGAFSHRLRRTAQAARLHAQGVPLPEALTRVGTPPFARQGEEQLMRHLGRRRLDRIYDWLLETDSGMKGGSALTPAVLLERLVVRLARSRG